MSEVGQCTTRICPQTGPRLLQPPQDFSTDVFGIGTQTELHAGVAAIDWDRWGGDMMRLNRKRCLKPFNNWLLYEGDVSRFDR